MVGGLEAPRRRPSGGSRAGGGKKVLEELQEELEARSLWERFKLSTSSCLGVCEEGPVVLVYPEGIMYGKVKEEDVASIIETHLIGNEPIEELKVSADLWQ